MAYVIVLSILLALALLAVSSYRHKFRSPLTAGAHGESRKQHAVAESLTKSALSEKTANSNWKDTDPIKFRPFKSTYYITMALQNSAPSELILMDSNYEARVLQRLKIMNDHPSTVMGAIPSGHAAVRELYAFLITGYLPDRYPDMFSLEQDGSAVRNCVTGRLLPATPPRDPLDCLRVIGETVDDDVFLLNETAEGHVCVAFLCCHPAGFDPSTKLGKLLRDIHEPVPSYEKIGPSMERFFSKLEAGRYVKRLNWSITTRSELFTPSGSHIYASDDFQPDEEVDIEQVRLRVELQTLTRLPKTGAILFPFKTYVYPLKEIRDEGLGPQLVDAIEGLKRGNAPGMWKYKGAARWGRSVCEYLNS